MFVWRQKIRAGRVIVPAQRKGLYARLIPATTAVTAAAAAATTAATATAAATLFARPSLVDDQRAAFVLLFVKALDCFPGRIVVGHFHKSKTFAAARVAVLNDLSTAHLAVRRKQGFQRGIRYLVAQVSDVQLLTHDLKLLIGEK